MVLLKKLENGFITIEMSIDDLCELHNALHYARKVKPERFEVLDLAITNLYEMAHHGFITDFGRYKNYKYGKNHNEFESWEDTEVNE